MQLMRSNTSENSNSKASANLSLSEQAGAARHQTTQPHGRGRLLRGSCPPSRATPTGPHGCVLLGILRNPHGTARRLPSAPGVLPAEPWVVTACLAGMEVAAAGGRPAQLPARRDGDSRRRHFAGALPDCERQPQGEAPTRHTHSPHSYEGLNGC
eukprot:5177095-Prymnesium_polylepis.1